MKFKEATEWQSSWLQGEIEVTYAQLVSVFGPEHSDGDGYKVQAEWNLKFDDGTYSTIYDYKEGDSYHGEGEGIPKEQVTCWHIGGSLCPEAVIRVVETLAKAGIIVEITI
jgi:hypothetical protein